MFIFRSHKIYYYFKIRARFPLYLLLHFVSQKDTASPGAKIKPRNIFHYSISSRIIDHQANTLLKKTSLKSDYTPPKKAASPIMALLQKRFAILSMGCMWRICCWNYSFGFWTQKKPCQSLKLWQGDH
jgi:hypothetical protein